MIAARIVADRLNPVCLAALSKAFRSLGLTTAKIVSVRLSAFDNFGRIIQFLQAYRNKKPSNVLLLRWRASKVAYASAQLVRRLLLP